MSEDGIVPYRLAMLARLSFHLVGIYIVGLFTCWSITRFGVLSGFALAVLGAGPAIPFTVILYPLLSEQRYLILPLLLLPLVALFGGVRTLQKPLELAAWTLAGVPLGALLFVYTNWYIQDQMQDAPKVLLLGCADGQLGNCLKPEGLYRTGVAVPQDPTKAVFLYQNACTSGQINACFNIAYLHYAGVGVPQDKHNAAYIFGLACDNAHPMSCYNAGRMYESGDGVVADATRATSYFKRACTMGITLACQD